MKVIKRCDRRGGNKEHLYMEWKFKSCLFFYHFTHMLSRNSFVRVEEIVVIIDFFENIQLCNWPENDQIASPRRTKNLTRKKKDQIISRN